MKTDALISRNELKIMSDDGKSSTTKEIVEMLISTARQKHCPSVNGNCLGDQCAMFIVDRPRTDQRYIEARCTHAGKRPLAFYYGLPKDYKEYFTTRDYTRTEE